jgi:phenylacetate-CoA ligase
MNSAMKTLQEMLHHSESQSLEENKQKQYKQLKRLIQHAYATVPFYKQYYAGSSLDTEHFMQLPTLSRAHVQLAGDDLISTDIPASHGATYPLETSGSTGQAVRVLGTDFTRLFYDALMLREHAWHARDFKQKLMFIRWLKRGIAEAPLGQAQENWGPPVNKYHETGPGVLINIASETSRQIEALIDYKPYYLATYPSQLLALAEYCAEHDIQLPSLHELRTTGETLTAKQMKIIKQVWPYVKLSDIYSCVELGNLAQQCPEYNNYHVNAEHVMLEIINNKHEPCEESEVGKVLVTGLLNYATPLIRYELGDYASWGEPCACGRGLPVIKKIYGRERNRLIMPSGESCFPYLGEYDDVQAITMSSIRKFQFIQHTTHDIEIKVVTPDTFTEQEEEYFKQLYQKNLGFKFNIAITYHEDIPAGPTGKFEEFLSLVH